MAGRRRPKWRGRALGAVGGFAAVGGVEAATHHVHDLFLAMALGAAAGLGGFVAGSVWDRRQELLEREQAWRKHFADGPGTEDGGADERGEPERSVLARLKPQRSPVAFERNRYRYVTPIRQWCSDGEPGQLWYLAGGPGSGKTRLAMQVTAGLHKHKPLRWVCGWVRNEGKQAIELARSWHQPVLAIVDDAEVRTDLPDVLSELHKAPNNQVRVLLVARDFGAWWIGVQQRLTFEVDDAETTVLGALGEDKPRQREAARHAVAAFAAQEEVDPGRVHVTGIGPTTPPSLLHAAALEGVLRVKHGESGQIDVNDAVTAILIREQQVWQRKADRKGLDAYGEVTVSVLRDLIILTMMIGVPDGDDPGPVVRAVPGLAHATPELVQRLLVWLRLYEPVVGYQVRPHLPAVFADRLTSDALADNPALAAALVSLAITPESAKYVLTMLARAASYVPTASAGIINLLAVDPSRLLPIVIGLARDGTGPIDHAIAIAVERADLDADTADGLLRQVPRYKQGLTHTRVAVARAAADTAPTQARRADCLITLADALRLVGRLDEAVDAGEAAVAVYRRLADDAHQDGLAAALTGLTGAQRHAGRRDAAVDAASEAVAIYRRLAETYRDAYQRDLAGALTELSDALQLADRCDEAIDAAVEAVALRRQLVDTNSETHRPYLAGALITLAYALLLARRRGEAVEPAAEAVRIYRWLVDTKDPDVYRPDLAGALTALADALRLARRRAEAVNAAAEAVALRRQLVDADPDAHRPYLAQALTILAQVLQLDDQRGEAAVAAANAVEVYRRLVDTDPNAFRPYLAAALTTLAQSRQLVGQRIEAIDAAAEAVEHYRHLLASRDNASFRHNLAGAEQIIRDLSR